MAVDLTSNFGEAFKLQSRCRADPGSQNSLIAHARRRFVIDLVPKNDPADRALRFGAGQSFPMRGRDVLDPAQINGVVDVILVVDVARLNGDRHFKNG